MRFWVTKAGEAKRDKGADIASVFLLGVLGLALLVMFCYPVVERGQTLLGIIPRSLFDISVIITIVGAAAVLLEPLLRRRRANWPHQIGISLWMLFLCPFFLCFVALLLNGLLDRSQPRTYDAALLNWRRTTSRRSNYVVATVRNWNREEGQQQKEVVVWLRGPEQWNVTHDTATLRVITKRGFFGYEWYVHLEPVAKRL